MAENAMALVFASDAQLHSAQQSRLMYIDSTFREMPSLFYQLFAIFVPHAKHAFPVVFTLMAHKTTHLHKTEQYSRKHKRWYQVSVRHTLLIADFEESPAAAVLSVFGAGVIV